MCKKKLGRHVFTCVDPVLASAFCAESGFGATVLKFQSYESFAFTFSLQRLPTKLQRSIHRTKQLLFLPVLTLWLKPWRVTFLSSC